MQRAWVSKPEIVAKDMGTSPTDALRLLYFDTVLHEPDAIRYLIDLAGVDRILLGTDYPFEMGDPDPIDTIDAIPGLTGTERNAILSGNVEGLLSSIR